jgi:nicotinamide riboside kinase
MFARYYHGSVPSELERFAALAEKRYDLFFLCGVDIPYDDTWDRSGEMNRNWFQRQIISDLKMRRVPYLFLDGSIEERVAVVKKVLAGKNKYENFYNLIERKSSGGSV